MEGFIKILAICIFLCKSSSIHGSEDLVVTKRAEFSVDGNARISYTRNILRDDNLFVFSVCDDRKIPEMIDCKINVRTDSISGSPFDRVCDLRLSRGPDRKLLDEQFPLEIEFLGKTTNIIVSWSEMKHDYSLIFKKSLIIDSTNCEIKYLSPNLPSDNDRYAVLTNPIVYENTFDLIFIDKKRCGNSKCRVTYNKDGEEITQKPLPFRTSLHYFKTTPMSSALSPKEFLVLGEMSSAAEGTKSGFVTNTGIEKRLLTNIQGRFKGLLYSVSTLHNNITICSADREKSGDKIKQVVSSVYCEQFEYGATRPRVKTTFDYSSKVGPISVLNLAKGGFVLLTLQCSSRLNPSCEGLTVEKYRDNGKKVLVRSIRPLKIECNEDLDKIKVHIRDQNGQYCVYISCSLRSYYEPKKIINYHTICIPRTREDRVINSRKRRSKDIKNAVKDSLKKA
ncbi:hypothetical protein QAD02_005895 [Eretmocerus hayati]|uniref:Uncharacterized protein n=1 Tax=Eretmocerus hayati TaxID=131215 RepID=A0ACC2N0H5_9HYME|nr:hypothetical protein QAD02_005895 [Eretmocerus hayati]